LKSRLHLYEADNAKRESINRIRVNPTRLLRRPNQQLKEF